MAVTLELLKRLNEHQVEFVLIGGLAAVLHGSQTITHDIDVCVPFNLGNMTRLLASLAGLNPQYRERPDLPFKTDPAYYAQFKNLYLVTDAGAIDLLGEFSGVGGYQEALKNSEVAELDGKKFRVLTIEAVIRAKRAAGRNKDLLVVRELEEIQKKLDQTK